MQRVRRKAPLAKRLLTDGERSQLFARQQRRSELNELEAERKRRVENVEKWASEERLKIMRKYARSAGQPVAEDAAA
jgi:hypothetical protein